MKFHACTISFCITITPLRLVALKQSIVAQLRGGLIEGTQDEVDQITVEP